MGLLCRLCASEPSPGWNWVPSISLKVNIWIPSIETHPLLQFNKRFLSIFPRWWTIGPGEINFQMHNVHLSTAQWNGMTQSHQLVRVSEKKTCLKNSVNPRKKNWIKRYYLWSAVVGCVDVAAVAVIFSSCFFGSRTTKWQEKQFHCSVISGSVLPVCVPALSRATATRIRLIETRSSHENEGSRRLTPERGEKKYP